MLISEMQNKIERIYEQYGDIEVLVSKSFDCYAPTLEVSNAKKLNNNYNNDYKLMIY